MKEPTYHIYLDSHERTLLLHSLVELKNVLLGILPKGRKQNYARLHYLLNGNEYKAVVRVGRN